MNLFVGNLNPVTNADGLKMLFSEFGDVVSSKVIFDMATGTSRGFGFVEMNDKNQGFDAIDNLDCSYFEGNIISVKEAKQNGTKPGGGGGNNHSFNKPRSPRPGGYNQERNFNKY
jgi:RNA recognition motif-containing protein